MNIIKKKQYKATGKECNTVEAMLFYDIGGPNFAYGGMTKVYDRTSSFDDVFSLAASNKDAAALTVTVWYEGTDDACTAENALDNSGSVSVKVVLGMI